MKIKLSKQNLKPFKEKKDDEKQEEKKEEGPRERSTISYLGYFFAAVFICIIVALVARFIFLHEKSTFSTNAYSVIVRSEDPFIISFDKNLETLSLINVPKNTKKRLQESLLLGVPIDGEIKASSSTFSKSAFPSLSMAIDAFIKPWAYSYKDMTVLDSVKLITGTLGVPRKDIKSYGIQISDEGEVEGMTQDQLYDVFKDSEIVNEQKSIQIINSSSVDGLAGIVAQVIKNVGGNVVSIESGEDLPASTLTAAAESTTLRRISHLLSIPLTVSTKYSPIADIKIVLGKDFGVRAQKE